MIAGFYFSGESFLHRLGAGTKLLTLVLICCLVFYVDDLAFNIAMGLLVLVVALIAQIPVRVLWRQLRPVMLFLGIIFVVELLILDWLTATLVVVRFFTLIVAASLVTLTTRSSALLDALERGLQPLRLVGVNPQKVSLALSLAIRFAPMIAAMAGEVREAQRVRGLERSVFAVAVPTVVRTLKLADDVAAAIDARGYDGKPHVS
ncbi:MAG: energy-coupling factor transporter transmembrane protein EcfT [Pseudomonadota bacterium]